MSLFQRRSTSANEPSLARPPLESVYIYAFLALVAFFVADTILTALRGDMLPTQAPPARIGRVKEIPVKSRADYQSITQRNPFNSDGVIPPALSNGQEDTDESVPVLSQLPLKLIGTIVHVNPAKSVATIQNTSKSLNEQFLPYRMDDEIKGMARILSIERKKVIFRNLNNNRKEYIEIRDDSALKLGLSAPKGTEEEVKQEGNRFILKRDDVAKYTSNLPDLLQQARAVPNIIPGSGGQVDGFRLLEIDEGSIFEKLGLKKMDVIKGVNGEPVNSPAKAMELYNELKSSNRIDIEVERNGRPEQFNYIIE